MSQRVSFLRSLLAASALISALALAAVPVRAADNNTYSYARIVRLSYVNGDVQIVRADKPNNWQPAAMNMPIQQGFAIGTNNGRAVIELEQGTTIFLAENSVLQFTELALANGGRITRLTLSDGIASFNTSLAAGDTFEVATSSFHVNPASKSEFRVDLFGDRGTIRVLNGKLSASSVAGTQEVPKGQTFTVNSKGTKTAMKTNTAPDEWDHWVSSSTSAQTVAETKTAAYTNAPFSYGMADLAAYGSWSYFPGYGYGWQPSGVGPGWAPFTNGQWSFYPAFGWTWISGDPWGWVPYHFGGWQYSSSSGWMWMPGDYGAWTAAPVQWVGVGNHVGWIPRAVSSLHSAPTPTPVIVSSKALGKEGKNRVFSSGEISAKTPMQTLSDPPPAPKGFASPQMASRIVAPTAANLSTLKAGLAVNAAAKVDANAMRAAGPPRLFEPMNAAMPAPRMPGRPPGRSAFSPDVIPGYSRTGTSGLSTSRAASVAMSAPASRASGAAPASGGGKPR